ncbi:MAG: sigma-70 domain-containing protein [Butyricicoccaceae bacterium]
MAERLKETNLRLIQSVVRQNYGNAVPLEEVLRAGGDGLAKAIETLDCVNQKADLNEMIWRIRQAAVRAIADRPKTVRISVRAVEEIERLSRAHRRLSRELGRAPQPKELADALGMEPGQMREMLRMMQIETGTNDPAMEDEE